MTQTRNARLLPKVGGEDLRDELVMAKKKASKFKIGFIAVLCAATLKDLIVLGMVGAAASKPPAVVLTKGSGEQETLEFQTGLQRSPALVRSFAISSMQNLHSWSNTAKDGGDDPGVQLKSGGSLPTTVYNQMVVLQPSFAEKYQISLAKMIESSHISDKNGVVGYSIESTSDLIPMADGRYQIKVVGNLIKVSPGVQRQVLPFNRLVFMKAIPPFIASPSEKMKAVSDQKKADYLRLKEFETAKGLMITDIKTLD
jgi:hypothetical protein